MITRAELVGALELVLPEPSSVEVLRAALLGGEAGAAAFRTWAESTGDPRHLGPGPTRAVRELGPLLDRARTVHSRPVPDRSLHTLLRAAGERERGRWSTFVTAAGDLLEQERAVPLVSGGTAVALRAYPEPALRHSHDLDLLGRPARTAEHASGLPLRVHAGRLPRRWGEEDDLAAVEDRAAPDDRLGPSCLLASVGDLLVVALGHAVASRSRHSVRWAADVCLLAQRADPNDWDIVVATAEPVGLGPVLAVPLGFVASALEAPVPPAVLDRLAGGPMPTGPRPEIALAWALAARARWPRLTDPTQRYGTWALLRWGLWPSSAYLAADDRSRARPQRFARWARGQWVAGTRRLRRRWGR